MKSIVAIMLTGISLLISLSACTGSKGRPIATAGPIRLTEDEKHRLYAAALAATEFPLDSNIFKEVCEKIGIFDAQGHPNDNYMGFVATHFEWVMKSETQAFKMDINTREKAGEYLNKHLP